MDPFVKKAGWSRNLLVGISGLIVGGLAIGWVAMRYINYIRSGGIPSGDTPFAQVAISYPQNGDQLEIGEFAIVDANAIGLNAFTSIELWLDGTLAGVQMAPEGGAQPFSTQFSWQPLTLGPHALIAIGVDEQEQKIISSQVVALVTESEIEPHSPDQTGLPAVLPAPPGGAVFPQVEPAAGASTGPAGRWQGSPGDWVNSLMADQKPIPPTLVARPMGCGANLLIHDQSDNEEGFVVYRQMVNSPAWLKLDTLSSQSKVEWIEVYDDGISGTVSYYISAFNSQGEAVSNIATVNIDPEGCPSEAESIFTESLSMTLKLAEAAAEKVYCYQSRDGVNWARWPVSGFLSPDEVGNLPEGPIALQRMDASDGKLEYNPMGLFMECWGWQGGELNRLGDFSVAELEPGLTGKQLIFGEGISAEIIFSTKEIKDFAGLMPMQINLMGVDQSLKPSSMPASPDIPRANLSVTSDRFACIKHLPNTIQGGNDQLDLCFLYPAYDPASGGTIPQPYLIWDFDSEPVCVGGASEECKTYQELLTLAEENGGQVGFTIQSMRGGKKTVWNVTEPNLTMFVVPPLSCIGDTAFDVRMWYRPGNKGVSVSASPENQASEIGEDNFSPPETFYGPYSNMVTIPCNSSSLLNPSIIEMVQYYDFTFETMGLSSLDDDDHLATEVVELYGYFYVSSPSMGYQVELPCYLSGFDNCYDGEPLYKTAGTTRHLLLADWKTSKGQDFIDGIYALEYERLCQSTLRGSCKYEGQTTYKKHYNNTIRVYKKEGGWLTFGVRLVDYDEASYDDTVCSATVLLFDTNPGASYDLTGITSDSGNCWVRIKVNKLGDPVPIGSIPDL